MSACLNAAGGNVKACIAILFMGALLSACTAWPPHGQGGLGEQRVPANSRETLPAELEEQLAALKHGLQVVQRKGFAACQPAHLLAFQRQLVSGERNLYGGMSADARLSLANAQQTLAELHSRAEQQTDCGIRHSALEAGNSSAD